MKYVKWGITPIPHHICGIGYCCSISNASNKINKTEKSELGKKPPKFVLLMFNLIVFFFKIIGDTNY